MPTASVTPRRIQIHKAGEDEAEWRTTIMATGIAGAVGNGGPFQWSQDGVSDNRTYTFDPNMNWLFYVPPGGKIRLAFFGYEEDGGLFDPSDTLPGIAVDLDPITAGSEYSIPVDAGEFAYTLVWGVNVLP